jgi:hypothetical protein
VALFPLPFGLPRPRFVTGSISTPSLIFASFDAEIHLVTVAFIARYKWLKGGCLPNKPAARRKNYLVSRAFIARQWV